MEKTISEEEKIKRAEEIYYRRKLNNSNVRMPSSQVKEKGENRQFSLYKKMILQILVCILIYLVFSLVKEANYMFSENIVNKTREVLSTDINFGVLYNNVATFFENNKDHFAFITRLWSNEENENQEENNIVQNEETNQNENTQSQNVQNENTQNEDNKQNIIDENTETQSAKVEQTGGIGGSINDAKIVTTSAKSKTQMEIDAEYIKSNFSMALPAKAVITSPYGKREPTEIVSENHQGIDIGVPEGTTIVAAMEGKVSVVSKEGDYGIHVKIVNKDITTIYAHCSKILVKEGDTIKKGQKIAISGNTGNTTGPHLHFEIRRNDRTVNPELILSWD